jgi:diacylglycerol O-acyltransferase
MSPLDELMLRLERQPSLRSTIVQVALLDQLPDLDVARTRALRGIAGAPRFRQVLQPSIVPGAAHSWTTPAEFDPDYHLRVVRLPAPGTMRQLLDYAALVALQPFDLSRPLWESHFVDGLPDGRAAAIQKIHHAMGDGIGLLDIAAAFLDLERSPKAPPIEPDPPRPEFVPPLALLADALGADARLVTDTVRALPRTVARVLRGPLEALSSAGEVGRSFVRIMAPSRGPSSALLSARSVGARFDVASVPLAELKAAARAHDAKLNSAFLAGVAGAMARYHDRLGVPVDQLRFAMPISTRTDSGLGNHFSPTRFTFPLGIDDPAERIALAREVTRQQRTERALSYAAPAARLLTALPAALVVPAFGHVMRSIDVITSNVPGSPVPVYLAGAQVLTNFGFSPRAGAAVNITLISHLDDAQLAVNTDPAAVSDPDVLIACLDDAFDEIRKAA